MGSVRAIAAVSVLVGACAAPPLPESSPPPQARWPIESNPRRSAPPRAAPPLVLALLREPPVAGDAAALFRRSVPAQLRWQREPGISLERYLEQLAEAQAILRSATRPIADAGLLRRLAEGLPSQEQLLAVADAVDAAGIERASALFLEATARFVSQAAHYEPGRFASPVGTVVIGGPGNDRHGPGAALIIDPGGDDEYERAPALAGAVSVIVDLGGNDRYSGSDIALRALSAIVELSGDDRYRMSGPGLGAAIAGASVIVDYGGDDEYEAGFLGEGAAAFGTGALIDLGGNDRYRLRAWGQGFGLAGGLGLLWDRAGHDLYAAAGEPDFHQRGSGLSGAQGAAFGFRGRLGGGIGILRDDAGDDRYEAQMFAQGLGYYYGLGLLWDLGGSDAYHAFRYAQGNGVHEAAGVLGDDGGDDHYALDNGYGQGMGLDLGVGALVDREGDDAYRARFGAQGTATANGFGLLADRAGADRFSLGADDNAWGRAEDYGGLSSAGVFQPSDGAKFVRDEKAVFIPFR
jgi:hypothetical protein